MVESVKKHLNKISQELNTLRQRTEPRNVGSQPRARQGRRRRNRANRRNNGMGPSFQIPPVAVGTVIRANEGGPRRVRGQDFIVVQQVPSSVTAGAVLVDAVITAQAGLRMSQATRMYQRWIPRNLTFKFSATGATSTPGMVCAAIVRDPDDTIPDDPVARLTWLNTQQGAIQFKNWSEATIRMTCSDKLFTSRSGEQRLWSPGKLVAVALTDNGAQPVSIVVNLYWDVELSEPSTEVASTSGPVTYTLPDDLYIKPVYTINTASANEDIHFATLNGTQSTDNDPNNWQFTAFDISSTPLAGLAQGDLVQFSTPWVATGKYADAEDQVLMSSMIASVYLNADVYNGSGATHTAAKANVLMPAWRIGTVVHPAGTIGTGTGRWHHFAGMTFLPRGTVVTVLQGNSIEVDETASMFIEGRIVRNPTGKRKWIRLEDNGTAPNYTQAQINSMPIVRVIPSVPTGLPVTVEGWNGSVPVTGNVLVTNSKLNPAEYIPVVAVGDNSMNGQPIQVDIQAVKGTADYMIPGVLPTRPLHYTGSNFNDTIYVTNQTPLTVAGNVGISSMPAVNIASGQSVGITGTPSVTVSGIPKVDVNSLPSIVFASGQTVGLTNGTTVGISGTPTVKLNDGSVVSIYQDGNALSDTNPLPIKVESGNLNVVGPVETRLYGCNSGSGQWNPIASYSDPAAQMSGDALCAIPNYICVGNSGSIGIQLLPSTGSRTTNASGIPDMSVASALSFGSTGSTEIEGSITINDMSGQGTDVTIAAQKSGW